MERLDRTELLRRAGGAALAASAWPALAGAAPPSGELRRLDRALEGSVVPRGAAGYGTARLLFNTRFDGVKPLAVAFPESVADVQKAIRWARRNRVRLAVRSGGHSYGGYSTTGGLQLDLSRLAAVRPLAAGRVRVGGGALLIDVYDRLARRGATIPAGSCPTVGIGGLALGGGVGLTSRAFGLTCDSLEELVLVTADGAVRVCSERENADLFWACRGGGGGNFGVVTSLTFRTHAVGDVTTFRIRWPWANARDVVRRWQQWAPAAPDGLFSLVNLAAAPGAEPRVACSGQLLGDEAECRALIQPLVDTGAPLSVSVVPRSFMTAVFYFAACGSTVKGCHPVTTPGGQVRRSSFAAKSAYSLVPLDPSGLEALTAAIESARRVSGLGSGGVLLDSYGGAINRVAADATAFVHRGAINSYQLYAYPGSRAAQSWLARFEAALRPHVSRYAYQNYIDPTLAGWENAYYGTNLPRLRQVKKAADPDNFFRFRQSIRPA